jgi:uracil-DNA glycosylase family 4
VSLELDDRQRAMLLEMGVRVWMPGTAFEVEPLQQPMAPAPAELPPPARVAAVEVALNVATLGWDTLAQSAASCQACGLCAGRKNTTLQMAAPRQADWMVVGDPPDEDEDRAGQAFAGEQGVLLNNMLKAVGTSRSGQGAAGAYVTNVTKCRPPHGRIAQPAELAQCASYLQREIAQVQPKMILAMGRFATQVLLGEHGAAATQPLGKLRGSVYRYLGVPVVVTYAPKVLLRASADKGKAWADLCMAVDVLAEPAP